MTAAQPHLVLWDVDGTLVSNGESDETLFVQAIQSVVPPTAEVVHPYRHGKTDLGQVAEYLLGNGGTPAQLSLACARLVEYSRDHFATPGERTVLPGVVETIGRLAAGGHINAILTGNGRQRAELKLFSAGLDRSLFDWSVSFFGDKTESRMDLTRSAAILAAGRALVAVIIGDTIADANAAEAAGIGFIGVATGVYGAAELRSAAHLLVVDDLGAGAAAVGDLFGA